MMAGIHKVQHIHTHCVTYMTRLNIIGGRQTGSLAVLNRNSLEISYCLTVPMAASMRYISRGISTSFAHRKHQTPCAFVIRTAHAVASMASMARHAGHSKRRRGVSVGQAAAAAVEAPLPPYLADRADLLDVHGRVMLKGLTLVELEEFMASLGEWVFCCNTPCCSLGCLF